MRRPFWPTYFAVLGWGLCFSAAGRTENATGRAALLALALVCLIYVTGSLRRGRFLPPP